MSLDVTFCLSPERKGAFRELKNRINNDYKSEAAEDYQIYRFLKARDYNVTQAENMLRKHSEWRKKHRTDTIINDFKMCEVQEKYFQINTLGYDYDGCPVLFLNFGRIDFKGILKSAKKSDIITYVIYFFTVVEKLFKEQSKKLNKPVETWTVILDFDNYALAQAVHKPAIDILLELFSLYEANFPERLKIAYVINASLPFYIAFNVMKPVLSAATLGKTHFFGKTGWKEELVQLMNPDDWPAFLGGRKTDPDGNPMCFTTIHHCGPVPKHYYFRSSERRICGQPGVKMYFLDRMGKVNILLDVDEPESFVEWEFETENNDIAYGLSYVEKETKALIPKPLIGTQRVDAHMQVEAGTYLCKKPGLYILTLDNSYSWLRQKQIFCRASVLRPNGQKCIVTI